MGYPWPRQPRYKKKDRIWWLCPRGTVRREGLIHGVSWVDSSIPAWVVHYLPRFIWWAFTNYRGYLTYDVNATDGAAYAVPESEIVHADLDVSNPPQGGTGLVPERQP